MLGPWASTPSLVLHDPGVAGEAMLKSHVGGYSVLRMPFSAWFCSEQTTKKRETILGSLTLRQRDSHILITPLGPPHTAEMPSCLLAKPRAEMPSDSLERPRKARTPSVSHAGCFPRPGQQMRRTLAASPRYHSTSTVCLANRVVVLPMKANFRHPPVERRCLFLLLHAEVRRQEKPPQAKGMEGGKHRMIHVFVLAWTFLWASQSGPLMVACVPLRSNSA